MVSNSTTYYPLSPLLFINKFFAYDPVSTVLVNTNNKQSQNRDY